MMPRQKQIARFLTALTAVAPLLMAAGAQAAEPTGSIEICRVLVAGDKHAGKPIEIPKGAVFGDGGKIEGNERVGNYWPLWVATLEPTTLPADQRCVTTRAQITKNLDRHSLRVAERRGLVPSGSASAPRDDWPADYDVAATVTADFR
jgi:hypothetical protein